MKLRYKLIVLGLILLVSFALMYSLTKRNSFSAGQKKSVRIGISLYRFDDTFISGLRSAIEEYVRGYEIETGIKVYLDILDAKDSQNEQESHVEKFTSLKYDAICINAVDRTDTSGVINTALASNTPIIFFNREPVEDDIRRSQDFFYVGSNPKDSAILQGKIIIDSYQRDKTLLDLNGDGQVNYVIMEGEPSHQDSIIRTEWSVKTLQGAGVPIHKLGSGIGNWERNEGSALMEQWLKEFPGQIELVISNNDDMALGAIDAIQRAGDHSGIKVVGIDGTPGAMEAMEHGELFGTVAVNIEEYAKAVAGIAIAKSLGQSIPEDIDKKLTDERYYSVSYQMITD